jgi:hypothetical protein
MRKDGEVLVYEDEEALTEGTMALLNELITAGGVILDAFIIIQDVQGNIHLIGEERFLKSVESPDEKGEGE